MSKIKVAVTGAGGRTGAILSRILLEGCDKFEHILFVRTEQSRESLKKSLGDRPNNISVLDVTSPSAQPGSSIRK
jgi:shikimate 5-dehydrogenase